MRVVVETGGIEDVSNVDHVRSQGVELLLGSNDLFVRGLELQGSATYTGAKTLELSGRASATAPEGTAIGKQLPNIPKRRATFSATYRPDQQRRLALTAAGRYSDKMYTTLDNADVNPNTYQGFGAWFVADARVSYLFDRHVSLGLGATTCSTGSTSCSTRSHSERSWRA